MEEPPQAPGSRMEARIRARSVKREDPEQRTLRTRTPRAEEPAALPGSRMEERIRARSVKREEQPERSVRAQSPRPAEDQELRVARMRGGGSPERRRELAEARLALTAPPLALTAPPPASPERPRRAAESPDQPARSIGIFEPDELDGPAASPDEPTWHDDPRPRRPMDAVLRGAGVPATPPPARDALRPVPLPDEGAPPRSPPRRQPVPAQPVPEEVRPAEWGTSFAPRQRQGSPRCHDSPARQGSPSRRRAQSPREPERSCSPEEPPRMASESVSPVRMRLLSQSALAKHLPSQLLAAVSRDVKRLGRNERPKFFCAPRKHNDPCRDGPGGPSTPVPGI